MKKKKADAPTYSLYVAFVAGFLSSGEGFNGEYPFDFDAQKVNADEDVLNNFKTWWHSIYERDDSGEVMKSLHDN